MSTSTPATPAIYKVPHLPTGPRTRPALEIKSDPSQKRIDRAYFRSLHIDLLLQYAKAYKVRNPEELDREELASIFIQKNAWIPVLPGLETTETKDGLIVYTYASAADPQSASASATTRAQMDQHSPRRQIYFIPERLHTPADTYSDDDESDEDEDEDAQDANPIADRDGDDGDDDNDSDTSSSSSAASSIDFSLYPPSDPHASASWLSNVASKLHKHRTRLQAKMAAAKASSSTAAGAVMHFCAKLHVEKEKHRETMAAVCAIVGPDVASQIREDVAYALVHKELPRMGRDEDGPSNGNGGGDDDDGGDDGNGGGGHAFEGDERAINGGMRPRSGGYWEILLSPLKKRKAKESEVPAKEEVLSLRKQLTRQGAMASVISSTQHAPPVAGPSNHLKRRREADNDEAAIEASGNSTTATHDAQQPRLPSSSSEQTQRRGMRREASMMDVTGFVPPPPSPIRSAFPSSGEDRDEASPKKKARRGKSPFELPSQVASGSRVHITRSQANAVAATPTERQSQQDPEPPEVAAASRTTSSWLLNGPLEDEDVEMSSDDAYTDGSSDSDSDSSDSSVSSAVSDSESCLSHDDIPSPRADPPVDRPRRPLQRAHTRLNMDRQSGQVYFETAPSQAFDGRDPDPEGPQTPQRADAATPVPPNREEASREANERSVQEIRDAGRQRFAGYGPRWWFKFGQENSFDENGGEGEVYEEEEVDVEVEEEDEEEDADDGGDATSDEWTDRGSDPSEAPVTWNLGEPSEEL